MSKEFKRRLLASIVPSLGALLIRVIYATCKKVYKTPHELPKEPFIVAFWHGELLMQPYLYRKVRKDHKIAVMISEHFDGELIAKTVERFGIEAVRGSTKKGAARVLLAAIKKMREGYDVAITPDGPRGPRHSVADGIAALSLKMDAYIVPFGYRAKSCWRLNSWDRFVIPKPFTTLEFFVGEPFKIGSMDKESAKDYIKKRMLQFSSTE